VDLGILQAGQPVPPPGSPRRDIASYGKRERAAFSALARFRIPASYPWTGVYADPESGASVVIVGNRTIREKSAVYLDGARIRRYRFSNGTLSWQAQGPAVPHGVMRLDLQPSAQRRIVLKTWTSGQDPGRGQAVVLPEADPDRRAVASAATTAGSDPSAVDGRYGPVNLRYGQALLWDGGLLEHGTYPNLTGSTRVSCDFRFHPLHPERVARPWRDVLAGRGSAPGPLLRE
jgi:hypothetical protein